MSKPIDLEEKKIEFKTKFVTFDIKNPGNDFIHERPSNVWAWIQSLLKDVERENFYLGYFSDGFNAGWEAYCKRYNKEFNPQIMLTEKQKWEDSKGKSKYLNTSNN